MQSVFVFHASGYQYDEAYGMVFLLVLTFLVSVRTGYDPCGRPCPR